MVKRSDDGPRYVPPYDGKELHLPRCNWCGPGTNVWRRLHEGVEPMHALDRECRKHDLDTELRGPRRARGGKAVRESDMRLARAARKIGARTKNPIMKAQCFAVAKAMELNKWRPSRKD